MLTSSVSIYLTFQTGAKTPSFEANFSKELKTILLDYLLAEMST